MCEVTGLRWVDIDAAVASIETQLVQIRRSVRESTPWSGASDAKIALDKATVGALRAWRKVQLAERLAVDAGLPPIRERDAVTATPRGTFASHDPAPMYGCAANR